jgi:hypothetical protein
MYYQALEQEPSMRTIHSTITPSLVRTEARFGLAQVVAWKPYGRKVTEKLLFDLLLTMAALRLSLSAVVRRFRLGFSHETARQAIRANLPKVEVLCDGLCAALQAFAGRRWKKRRFVLAIDEHYVPFYGQRNTKGVVGGNKKQGTKYFYAYATAVLIHKRHRYTIALQPLTTTTKPHEVVHALLKQAWQGGFRLRGVVLDSGFDSGETLLLLQQAGLSYVVPLRRKGRGLNRRNACFALPTGTMTRVDWKTEKTRQRVATDVLVDHGAGGAVKVFAFGGWSAGAATSAHRRKRLIKNAYRRRFGIETSYRQMNESKASTSAKDIAYRLLLIGVALLLRQVWVYLTACIALAQRLKPDRWVEDLTLSQMISWLADDLRQRYKENQCLHLQLPFDLISGHMLF